MFDFAFNPLIDIHDEGGEALHLVAPKPGAGLQSYELRRSANAGLFDFFESVARTGMLDDGLLDDLDPDEFELLRSHGFILRANALPEQPLFAALLTDVDEFADDIAEPDLIINPTFRFINVEPAHMRSWMHDRRHSGRPSAWITKPVTGIELGYWLSHREAALVSQFVAGDSPQVSLDPALKRRLLSAGILTSVALLESDAAAASEWISVAKSNYELNGYAVLRDLVPRAQSEAMKRYYRNYVADGFMPFDDAQSERYYQHNEPLARTFHGNFTKLMSLVVGSGVIPSYVYAGSYIAGSALTPHVDRAQCEFSISMQVDFCPDIDRNPSPWGLFLKQPATVDAAHCADRHEDYPADSQERDSNPAVYLSNGDAVIYKGCELVHYRYPLADGCASTSLFMHYVPVDFGGDLD